MDYNKSIVAEKEIDKICDIIDLPEEILRKHLFTYLDDIDFLNIEKCTNAKITYISRKSISFNLKEVYPHVDETITPLPREISTNDKERFAKAESQFYWTYNYTACKWIGQTDWEGGYLMATSPIPESCHLYYFEITVINCGENESLTMGLSPKESGCNQLDPYQKCKLFYHSRGFFGVVYWSCKYNCQTPTKELSDSCPSFGIGDVIGCGFNQIKEEVFFTKNGKSIGWADLPSGCFELPDNSWFPTIHLGSKNQAIEVNFGQKSFVYCIVDHYTAHRET